MDFYYIVCENDNGDRCAVSNSFFANKNDTIQYLDGFNRNQSSKYKNIEIKQISVSIEDIIVALVKDNNEKLSSEFCKLLLNPTKVEDLL